MSKLNPPFVIPGRPVGASPESISAESWLWIPDSRVAASGMTLVDERNVSRLIEARLHAVSSRNMYSEHGLLARIGPDAGQVCQSFTVVWNCRPGSAQAQAA